MEDIKKHTIKLFILLSMMPLFHNSSLCGGVMGDFTEYTCLEKENESFGAGSFGTTYRVKNKQDTQTYMLKINQKHDEVAGNESQVLNLLKGQPNIIQLIEEKENNFNLLKILEFGENGSVDAYIKKEKSLDTKAILTLFRDIVNGVASMNRKDMAHLDIKTENAVVMGDKSAKLIDFDMSSKLGTFTPPCGTPFFFAPEMINKGGRVAVNSKLDVYSLGVVLYEMTYKESRMPVNANTLPELIFAKKMGVYPFHSGITQEVMDIILKCLKVHPVQRISVKDLLTLVDNTIANNIYTHIEGSYYVGQDDKSRGSLIFWSFYSFMSYIIYYGVILLWAFFYVKKFEKAKLQKEEGMGTELETDIDNFA